MQLCSEVHLGPDQVLDGDPASPPLKGAQQLPLFSANVCCGQTVAYVSYCWARVVKNIRLILSYFSTFEVSILTLWTSKLHLSHSMLYVDKLFLLVSVLCLWTYCCFIIHVLHFKLCSHLDTVVVTGIQCLWLEQYNFSFILSCSGYFQCSLSLATTLESLLLLST